MACSLVFWEIEQLIEFKTWTNVKWAWNLFSLKFKSPLADISSFYSNSLN